MENRRTPARSALISGSRSSFDWYRQIGNIILGIDLPSMPGILVDSIRQVVSFEHAVIFGYPEGRRPIFLFDGFSNARKVSTVGPYLNGSYLVDPFYEACINGIEAGLYRMRNVAPDEFYENVGGDPGYVSPCVSDEPGYLSEEIGYFAHNEHNAYVVLSLMRPHDHPPFSSAEFAWLSRIEPVVRAAMAHFWRDLGSAETESSTLACLGDYVDRTLMSFGEPVLSTREQEVARLILRGHSSASTAANLGISTGTVKIHRRNLYAKLNISSQSELFSLFIDVLASVNER